METHVQIDISDATILGKFHIHTSKWMKPCFHCFIVGLKQLGTLIKDVKNKKNKKTFNILSQ